MAVCAGFPLVAVEIWGVPVGEQPQCPFILFFIHKSLHTCLKLQQSEIKRNKEESFLPWSFSYCLLTSSDLFVAATVVV